MTATLEPIATGIMLTTAYDGFDLRSPSQKMTHDLMGSGWVGINRKIGLVRRGAGGGA